MLSIIISLDSLGRRIDLVLKRIRSPRQDGCGSLPEPYSTPKSHTAPAQINHSRRTCRNAVSTPATAHLFGTPALGTPPAVAAEARAAKGGGKMGAEFSPSLHYHRSLQ